MPEHPYNTSAPGHGSPGAHTHTHRHRDEWTDDSGGEALQYDLKQTPKTDVT